MVGLEKGSLKGLHGRARIEVNLTFSEADAGSYDAMVIPGGRGPANLRKHPEAVDFVRRFARTRKDGSGNLPRPPDARRGGVPRGKDDNRLPQDQDEMQQAGAEFVDAPVVVDENLITSRDPGDLPDFNGAIEDALS